ncbi:MAG: competence protein ComEA [Solirubrobacterales bacterium]|jgi:competence protein ComEA|nr:competence protein ComEA [Solirubrobacterales bacterium]
MPEMSRSQVVVYAAVALALLLVGARAIRGEADTEASFAAETGGGGGSGASLSVTGSRGEVVVDVTGAVRRPGVYRMPVGSRVNDAVARAGGAVARAELEAINLAAQLADGQQVVVPEAVPGGAATVGGGAEDGPISLGTATVEQLEEIEGIGPVTAGDIIAFRDEHGGLSSIDQLDQVPGIGPATMDSLRARLQP